MIRRWYKGRRVSRALLFRHLTLRQRINFVLRRRFKVCGSEGNSYKIFTRTVYGIKGLGYYRCLAVRNVPIYDHMLAIKLLIETNEREFLKRANTEYSPFEAHGMAIVNDPLNTLFVGLYHLILPLSIVGALVL